MPENDSRSGGDCALAPPCKEQQKNICGNTEGYQNRRGPDEFAAPHGFAAFAETKAGEKNILYAIPEPDIAALDPHWL